VPWATIRRPRPPWHGPYYVLHAYDHYGVKVRVVADAQLYDAGPRIIHGQTDEASKR
jgi:hypothetical protein